MSDVKPGLRNVYTVYDKVAKQYRGLFYANTDEEMLRTSLPTVLMDFPLRDIVVFRVATFDDYSGVLIGVEHVQIDTNQYLFPHSRLSDVGDDLPIEKVDEYMKSVKSEMVANRFKNKE